MNRRKFTILSMIWVPVLLIAMILAAGCQGQGGGTPPAAQSPASSPADVKPSPPPVASPSPEEMATDTPTPITGNFVRRTNRDPFIPVVGKPSEGSAAGSPQVKGTAKIETKVVEGGEKKPEKHKGPIMLPEDKAGVSVVGILKVNRGYKAILRGGKDAGKSFIVTSGQKIGGWTVSSISSDTVVLKGGQYIAKLKLKEGGAASAKAKEEKNVPTEEGPPPAPGD